MYNDINVPSTKLCLILLEKRTNSPIYAAQNVIKLGLLIENIAWFRHSVNANIIPVKAHPIAIDEDIIHTFILLCSALTQVIQLTMGGRLMWSGGEFIFAMNMDLTAINSSVNELISCLSLSFRYSCTISLPLTPSKTSNSLSWAPMVGHCWKLWRRTVANLLSKSCNMID